MRSKEQVGEAITEITVTAFNLAAAVQRETGLEAQRPLVKSEAISRIMALPDPQKDNKPYSATAAEKLVETDLAYQLHRQDQSDAEVSTIVARGKYEAAKVSAWLSLEVYRVEQSAPAAAPGPF